MTRGKNNLMTQPKESTSNPPLEVRMARTQEELNHPPKTKRVNGKKRGIPKSISDAEWAERMSKFIGIKNYTPMTLEEIATVLGCTRERVRQIEVEAIKKIREKLEEAGINSFKDISAETHYSSGYTESDRYKEY